MTEDEVKELNEQIDKAGGSKYANSFTVIGDNHGMSILFMTHEVPTTCVTISYKACRRLMELLQESLDNAKAKEVSAENVSFSHPDLGTTLEKTLAESADIGLSALQYKALAEKDMSEAQKAYLKQLFSKTEWVEK